MRLITTAFFEQFNLFVVELQVHHFNTFADAFHSLIHHQSTEGKISLTADGWDNKSMQAFLAVTAHYIRRVSVPNAKHGRGALKLETGLVAFLPTPGRHTGKILADCLLKITDRAKITGRVSRSIISRAINIDYFYRCRMLLLMVPLTCNPCWTTMRHFSCNGISSTLIPVIPISCE